MSARSGIVAALALLAALLPNPSFAGPAPPLVDLGADRQAPGGPALVIEAPRRVDVGQPIELTVRATGVTDLAGYEMALNYDATVAELGFIQQRRNALAGSGRHVGPLGPVESATGVAFGAYSCPFSNCLTRRGSRVGRGVSGSTELARLSIVPNRAGTLELRIEGASFADSTGASFAVRIPRRSFTVRVGARGAGPSHPAPRPAWDVQPLRAPRPGIIDLTGDQRVTHADVMETAISWQVSRARGAPCGVRGRGRDVNRDGCVDISDVQSVASGVSRAGRTIRRTSDGDTSGATVGAVSASSLSETTSVSATGATFTVTSTGDQSDPTPGDGVCNSTSGCTLRAAITEANLAAGPNTITFNISGTGVRTIVLNDRLPTISDESGPTTIDGYTQPGASPNTHATLSNAAIRVEVTGTTSVEGGFYITSASNILRGLAVYDLKQQIVIQGSGARENQVLGTYIGTNAAGTNITPY
ncbi:MAG: CSLREA domain-containing protein, partial [Chloroflexi bacterium]|nr:CSLREA domain-containing protein [Chloroflexota bacterium]